MLKDVFVIENRDKKDGIAIKLGSMRGLVKVKMENEEEPMTNNVHSRMMLLISIIL